MTTPLDDVDFLARSPHRVRVLETLDGGPITRRDLKDRTGIAQATLTRILDDLVERNWVHRRGQTYELTPLGEVIADEFADLLETVGTMQRLGSVAEWLPELPFDLRLLADATVTLPTETDVFAHMQRVEELVAGADRWWAITGSVFRESLERQHRRSVESDQRHRTVLTRGALERARSDPEVVRLTRELLGSGNVDLYCYDGTFPCLLALADDVAIIAPLDGNGYPRAAIESRNPAVRAWVEETLQGYVDAAEPVSASWFEVPGTDTTH